MNLSIDLRSPDELPSSEEVQRVFKHAEDMGLEKNFDHVHVGFPNNRQWISFDASYKPVYTDDTPNDLCVLMIILEIRKGKLFGRFRIWDPKVGKNIAYLGLLPYQKFLPIIKKAKEIGTLHRDIRAQWHELKGWEDLLDHLSHN